MPQTPLTLPSFKDEYPKSVSILQWKHRLLLGNKAETIIALISLILDFTPSSYQKPVASAMTSTDEGIIAF